MCCFRFSRPMLRVLSVMSAMHSSSSLTHASLPWLYGPVGQCCNPLARRRPRSRSCSPATTSGCGVVGCRGALFHPGVRRDKDTVDVSTRQWRQRDSIARSSSRAPCIGRASLEAVQAWEAYNTTLMFEPPPGSSCCTSRL
ncbi:hypothetical protein OH77DRAFT_1238896 [Trametes cingulata]|nr:hypothetical protein OH77DRAFT_1238896 [Trametes cingulata]